MPAHWVETSEGHLTSSQLPQAGVLLLKLSGRGWGLGSLYKAPAVLATALTLGP